MSTLSLRHGWTLRRDDGVACTCKPVNPRHVQGWLCIPIAEVEAFQRANPEIKTLANARRMLWLERNFAPIPDAEIPF